MIDKLTPQKKYKAKAIKRYYFELNKNTNVDLIEKLEFVKNRQGYLKELIRYDEKKFKEFL